MATAAAVPAQTGLAVMSAKGHQHTGQMDAGEVIEYAAQNEDGGWEVRTIHLGEQYSAGQWARDQQALGARVLRRRVIVVDDWKVISPGSG